LLFNSKLSVIEETSVALTYEGRPRADEMLRWNRRRDGIKCYWRV
jgi:hypothetical protein